MANVYLSKLKGGSSVNLQASKTVTAGTTQQTFAPDTGYDAMEEVVVNPTPSTSITPSNASPVDIAANTLYKPTAAGKAVASVSNITPSNSSPASMSSGGVYKSGGAGYAIESYQSKTPSSGGTQFDAGMVKMSSGGYAYDSQQSGFPNTLFTNFYTEMQAYGISTINLSNELRNAYNYITVSGTTGGGKLSIQNSTSSLNTKYPINKSVSLDINVQDVVGNLLTIELIISLSKT